MHRGSFPEKGVSITMKQKFDPAFFELFQKTKERNLFRLTKRFNLLISQKLELKMAEHGFPGFKIVYYGFLANLDLNGTISSDLSARLCVTKQAISKMTKEIESLGFIKFFPHETDGRSSVIQLTEKGEELLVTGMTISQNIRQELVEIVGEPAIDQMISTLKLILDENVLSDSKIRTTKKA